jgi:hypothetical protein
MTETRIILAWLEKVFDVLSSAEQSESGKNEWINTELQDWARQWQEFEEDYQKLAIALCKGLAVVNLIPYPLPPRALFNEACSVRWRLVAEEILLRFQLIPY